MGTAELFDLLQSPHYFPSFSHHSLCLISSTSGREGGGGGGGHGQGVGGGVVTGVASDFLTTICHLAIVNVCVIIILSLGNTQISALLLWFVYLFVELMITMNE